MLSLSSKLESADADEGVEVFGEGEWELVESFGLHETSCKGVPLLATSGRKGRSCLGATEGRRERRTPSGETGPAAE